MDFNFVIMTNLIYYRIRISFVSIPNYDNDIVAKATNKA